MFSIDRFFAEMHVCSNILHDVSYWKPSTGECVFHDPDFDDDESFALTIIDMERVEGSVWDGYRPSYDRDIDRGEAVRRILDEEGWQVADTVRMPEVVA